MREYPKRTKVGTVVVRVLACLLLAASLAMLLLPWAELRVDDGGQRLTLRELAQNEERRSGRSFRELVLSRLSERDEGLYAGLLRVMDPLLDDEMSLLRVAASCTGAARWLDNYSTAVSQQTGGTEPETQTWVRSVQASASKVQWTAAFLWILLIMLLITGAYAIYAAAVGYGFGVVPYLVCSVPAFVGALLAVSRGNAWYGGTSRSAWLLQTVILEFRSAGNPVSVPFRLGLGAILFEALLVAGLLLALCVPDRGARRRESVPAPRPAPAKTARPLPNVWRCAKCGTLMGDGVYCVKCGSRKPEPRRCAGCGARLEEDARFCTSCGQPAENRQTTPEQCPTPEPEGTLRPGQQRLLSTMAGTRSFTAPEPEQERVPQVLLWSGSRKREEFQAPDDSDL